MASTTTTENPVLGTGVNDNNMAFTCSTTSSTPTWPTLTEQIYTNTNTTTNMDPASFLDHSHHHHHHHQQHHQPTFPQMVAPLTPDMHLMAMPPSSPSKSCPQVMDTAGCCAFGTPYDAPTFAMDPQAPPGYKSEMMLPPTPEVSTVSMSPPDGVTMLSEHHHHSTAYVFGSSNNGTDHMIQHESAPTPVNMMHHHPYFDNSNNELFSSSWSSPTTSSEEESGIATTAAAATVDCLQHPTTMTRDQLIGRVLELEHERRQYFTPLLLDMPDSSSAPATAINKPTTLSSSRDTERYFCHWGECNVQTGQLAELIQHIRHVHVGSGKQAYYCKWAGCSRQDKPFVKRHKMHNHIRTHTGEKPFACKIQDCDKRFSRLDSLKTHMKTHLPVRPHLCTEHGCNKAYFHARSLRKHLKSHAIAASRRQQKHQAQK